MFSLPREIRSPLAQSPHFIHPASPTAPYNGAPHPGGPPHVFVDGGELRIDFRGLAMAVNGVL